MSQHPIDIDTLKSRLKTTWMTGDFGLIAKSYEAGAADFVHRLGLAPGMKVLDVACGTGNIAIPAARMGAEVIGVDIATNLLEQARTRVEADGLVAKFDEGDAENLPYPDASFDAVISMFGVMFAPRPERSAAELLRVCRPGGTIALANWTPDGFIGQMFKTVAGHVPPPTGVQSPLLWGDPDIVSERLGRDRTVLQTTRRTIMFKFSLEPVAVVEFWRVYYGPTNRAFESLISKPSELSGLRADLERPWASNNRLADGTTQVESEYLEVIAKRMQPAWGMTQFA